MIGVVGSGQVGQHVAAELRKRGVPFYLFSRTPASSSDGVGVFVEYTMDNIERKLQDHGITRVINCAALRDIRVCETKPHIAYDANVELAKIIGDHARQVYLSTDYVFDLNEEDRPLSEEEPSRGALSVYGETKFEGEKVVLARDGVVARISSPFGLYPSPLKAHFVDFITSKLDTIDLPSDQFFSVTYLPDAAPILVDLLDEKYTGTYHVVNAGRTNWVDFARTIRYLAKNKGRVTGSMRWDTTRPRYGAILNKRLPRLRHWTEAAQEYLSGPRAEGKIKR
jgi:dTDP-4-dehydrorhamnose reductase